MQIVFEEIVCPVCNQGIYNGELCSLCNGIGRLLRVKDAFAYKVGQNVIAEYSYGDEEDE